MKLLFKWIFLTILTLISQNLILFLIGIKTNLFFLLLYFFIIEYYFPKEQKRNISPTEIYPLLFFVCTGFIEDLGQGIIGPSIISKSVTGFFLINLTNQFFFNWTEQFKGTIIFLFTLFDEIIYTAIFTYFFNISVEPLSLFKDMIIRALFNIPLGLFITWGRP